MPKSHLPYPHLPVLRVAHDPSRFPTPTPFRRSPDHLGREQRDAARRATRPRLRGPRKPARATAASRRDHPHDRRPATPPPSPPARRHPAPRRLPRHRPHRAGGVTPLGSPACVAPCMAYYRRDRFCGQLPHADVGLAHVPLFRTAGRHEACRLSIGTIARGTS